MMDIEQRRNTESLRQLCRKNLIQPNQFIRWKEAFDHGCAPKVNLAATSVVALEFVDLDDLKEHAT